MENLLLFFNKEELVTVIVRCRGRVGGGLHVIVRCRGRVGGGLHVIVRCRGRVGGGLHVIVRCRGRVGGGLHVMRLTLHCMVSFRKTYFVIMGSHVVLQVVCEIGAVEMPQPVQLRFVQLPVTYMST